MGADDGDTYNATRLDFVSSKLTSFLTKLTSVVSSSVAVSSSRKGDSSELVVLWESVVGLALFRFLLLVVLVVVVLVVFPVGALPGEECRVAAPEVSVTCEGGVAVRTWLSLHTECLACCSWEKVY